MQEELVFNDFDQSLQSLLHVACCKGNVEMVKVLIEFGVDVNSVDSAKKSGLYYALKGEHLEIVRCLIRENVCPWSDDFCNYGKVRASEDGNRLMRIGRRIQTLYYLCPQKWRKDVLGYMRMRYLETFELPTTVWNEDNK